MHFHHRQTDTDIVALKTHGLVVIKCMGMHVNWTAQLFLVIFIFAEKLLAIFFGLGWMRILILAPFHF